MIGINKAVGYFGRKGHWTQFSSQTYICMFQKTINITLIEWSEPESKPL